MSGIILLSKELKNKIAAGEVVERPASVVKELMENSIDAGATAIELEVGRGGKRLIRVSDNGGGMEREDALLCFQRHATSKLHSEEELFSIKTLGFRGEALPSMASVSRMLIETAPRGSSSGVSVRMEGGEAFEVRDAPANGTTVEVRDLFYNTPARKKFLKRDGTELVHIIDTATRLALPHPGIGFRVRVDGEETMNLPRASGLRERVGQLYGVEFLEGLLELDSGAGRMRLHAFVSKPDNLRETRANQMLFVNRRAVRDASVSHAVYSAYEGILARDRHPMFFLFLELDPGEVDFNVHPTKREVRFGEKDVIYRFVRRGVLDGLTGRTEAASRAVAEKQTPSAPQAYPGPGSVSTAGPTGVSEAVPLGYRAELPFIYLGDAFVAVSEAGGLTLIDHHAAHERVLYEKLLRGMDLKSRQLLFPRQVNLSHKEYVVLMEHRDMLFDMGMEMEDFGHNTVMVRSVPEEMDEADLRGILSDAADVMLAGGKPGRSLREAVSARVACHGSIRGKKLLTREGLNALLSELESAEDPDHCPHGRPTRVSYSLDDLKKLFKRK
jgi:DNA mismatch repair protein MutL